MHADGTSPLARSFEWNGGYSVRFGIVHVDYDTLWRYPKATALWLRRGGGVAAPAPGLRPVLWLVLPWLRGPLLAFSGPAGLHRCPSDTLVAASGHLQPAVSVLSFHLASRSPIVTRMA
jgi:hypothetical protein